MSLGEDGYVSQPYVAWVDFWIQGGDSLTKVQGKPARLLSFEHTIRTAGAAGGGASEWRIDLFDRDWLEIEEKVFDAVGRTSEGDEDKMIEFQYYYLGGGGADPGSRKGLRSIRYSGIIQRCSPTFTAHGVSLTIEGFENWMNARSRKKTESYETLDYLKGKKIHEIIHWIISIRDDWETGYVEPTKEILDTSSFALSREDQVYFNNEEMDHLQFIKEKLIPRSTSAVSGKSGYVLYMEPIGKGKTRVHYQVENVGPGEAHRQEGSEGIRTFRYIRDDKNTEVISFSPDIIAEPYASMKGSNEVAIVAHEMSTKRVKRISVDDDNTPEKTLYNPKSHDHINTKPGQSAKVLHRPSRNFKEAENLAQGWFYSEWIRNYQATLEIVGDPRIKPMQMVRVFLILPDGRMHYTSGGYLVSEVVHKISPGAWITTLKLLRGTSAKGYEATGDQANWG